MFSGVIVYMIACFLLWFNFPQKFNKGDITLFYNAMNCFYFKSLRIKKGHKAFSLTVFSTTCSFLSLLGRTERRSRIRYLCARYNSPQQHKRLMTCFCVSQGNTCHLVPQPDLGVLAKKDVHSFHRC